MFARLGKFYVALVMALVWIGLATFHAGAQTRNLDFYINTALATHPLFNDLKNQAAANSIDSQRLLATFKPQVTGVSSNSYAPTVNGWGYDQAITNGAVLNEMVNVSQAFVGKHNLAAQARGIGVLTDSLVNSGKLTGQDLKRNITAQYVTAYGDLQQVRFYREVYHLLSGQEKILKKLAESNIYRQTDYLTYLVTMKQQALQLKQLQIQYRNDCAQLNYLCGIFDTSASELDDPGISLHVLPDTAVSVFFLQFRLNTIKLESQAKIIDYSYKPKLSAFANAGYSSTLSFEAYKNFGVGVGINLTVPIYDGRQRQMLHQKIELQQQTNSYYKDFFTRQYDQQLAMLRQQLASTEALVADINDQVKYAEGLINVNNKLLETGDVHIADLVIAINNYMNAKNLLTQNSVARLQIINQINYWDR